MAIPEDLEIRIGIASPLELSVGQVFRQVSARGAAASAAPLAPFKGVVRQSVNVAFRFDCSDRGHGRFQIPELGRRRHRGVTAGHRGKPRRRKG